MNKPNESSPLADTIRASRLSCGLSQTAAARLIHCSCRTWQQWEAGDRHMHPAFWELFKKKSKASPMRAAVRGGQKSW